MTRVTQRLAEGSGHWQLAINTAEVTAFLHLEQCLSASGARGSVQIHGIGGGQGVAGRLEGEPGFPRGPGAEQETLSGPFSSFLPLRVIAATSVSLLSITSSGRIWEDLGGL